MQHAASVLDPHRYSRALVVLGLAGALLFGLAFLVSLLAPTRLEAAAKQLLANELRDRASAQLERVQDSRFGQLAGRMLSQNSEQISALKAQLASDLPARIDAVLARMRNPDCECREGPRRSTAEGLRLQIADLERAGERIGAFLESGYRTLSAQLHREFRIFTGANALVLLAVGIAALLRRRAGPHLLPSALLILLATAIVAGFYLFGQNWLRTLVFSDYLGFGYIAWIGVVSLPLFDVAFNRGRVMTWICNRILEAMGSATSVCPC
jgi:hypothetical protein